MLGVVALGGGAFGGCNEGSMVRVGLRDLGMVFCFRIVEGSKLWGLNMKFVSQRRGGVLIFIGLGFRSHCCACIIYTLTEIMIRSSPLNFCVLPFMYILRMANSGTALG